MDQRTCSGCAERFAPQDKRQRYCTPTCRKRASNARWQATHTPQDTAHVEPCTHADCTRVRYSHGLCKMHHAREARANGRRLPSDAWNDNRRNNYQARRARNIDGRNGDRALLSDIIERDGLACAWCGLPVDLAIAWPDRMSKSIDHKQPVSRGGEHTLANTQLMHLSCNASKGARIVA